MANIRIGNQTYLLPPTGATVTLDNGARLLIHSSPTFRDELLVTNRKCGVTHHIDTESDHTYPRPLPLEESNNENS